MQDVTFELQPVGRAHDDHGIRHAAVRAGGRHHLSACPMRAMSRDGGTVDTSCDIACAICARRLSFGVSPYTSLHSRARPLSVQLAPLIVILPSNVQCKSLLEC